jgi:hypothetical protein
MLVQSTSAYMSGLRDAPYGERPIVVFLAHWEAADYGGRTARIAYKVHLQSLMQNVPILPLVPGCI